MYIKDDYSFNNLLNLCWCGAVDTLNRVAEEGLEFELLDILENVAFEGETPTLTQVNDLLWFDSEWVFDLLGISEEEGADE